VPPSEEDVLTGFSTATVNFGSDLSLSCRLNLNLEQLQSYCSNNFTDLAFTKQELEIFD